MSDGGDVMGWWGVGGAGAHVRARGLEVSPLLSQVPVPLSHCLPPPYPHGCIRPRSSGSPPPRQWKKPVIHAAVGGHVFTSKNSGLCRVFVHFIHLHFTQPRTSFFLQSSLLSSGFSWRDGSSSSTKCLCLSQFQGHSSEGLSAGR